LSRPIPADGAEKKAALSRDLSEFLIELSIAVHRFAMYPPEHPSLRPATENVIQGLATLLQDRPMLAIGIAPRQLVIQDVATDERHPVLSDLARRLHGHQLSALTFERGTTLDELETLLRALSEEPERGGEALGLLPEDLFPRWEHLRVDPIAYDRLVYAGEGVRPRSQQIWLRMAQAALGGEEIEGEGPDARSLARVMEERAGDTAYDKVIVGYLLQLAEELKGARGAMAEEIRQKMSELIREVSPEALQRIIQLGGTAGERRRLLREANRGGVSVDGVIRIMEAAAGAEGQSISSSLTRLLSKLAIHAESGSGVLRAEAESAVRENVEELISDWELTDPNPDAYTLMLDRMARSTRGLGAAGRGRGAGEEEEDRLSGAERLIQMSLEVDAFGPTVQKAVIDLVEDGAMARVLELIESAPPGSRVASTLRTHLLTPAQLKRLLAGEDVDDESLRVMVAQLGTEAIDPLFTYLRDSESRAVRRKIFDVLLTMGEPVALAAVEHLRDERWFVKRNMLALLQRFDALPDGFSPLLHLQNPDPRVRREALPLALHLPATRTRALAMALADEDERIVRTALLEVQSGLPETLVPVVVNRIIRSESFPMLRSLAVRAVGTVAAPLTLETFLEVCLGGRTLFGKARLAPKSPELLIALAGLVRFWPEEPRVQDFISLARKSGDLQIQNAVEGGGRDR